MRYILHQNKITDQNEDHISLLYPMYTTMRSMNRPSNSDGSESQREEDYMNNSVGLPSVADWFVARDASNVERNEQFFWCTSDSETLPRLSQCSGIFTSAGQKRSRLSVTIWCFEKAVYTALLGRL